MTLKQRILSYIEAHRRVLLKAVPMAFTHERPFSIYRAIVELKQEKWIKVRQTYVEDGWKHHSRNVMRTKRTMYKQQKLDL